MRELIIGLLATVALVMLFVTTMSEIGDRISVLRNLKRLMLQNVRRVFMRARFRFVDLLAIAMTTGVVDEILFRGGLQTQLSLLPESIFFGLVHRPGTESAGQLHPFPRGVRPQQPLAITGDAGWTR